MGWNYIYGKRCVFLNASVSYIVRLRAHITAAASSSCGSTIAIAQADSNKERKLKVPSLCSHMTSLGLPVLLLCFSQALGIGLPVLLLLFFNLLCVGLPVFLICFSQALGVGLPPFFLCASGYGFIHTH